MNELRNGLPQGLRATPPAVRWEAAHPPATPPPLDGLGRWVLGELLTGPPCLGPLHLAGRLDLFGARRRALCQQFDRLRAAGHIQAPADVPKGKAWTVTGAGRTAYAERPAGILGDLAFSLEKGHRRR